MTLARGVALGAALAVLVVGCSDDNGDGAGAGGDDATTTTMATGGIAIEAPEGWTEIPVPILGFGVAVPPGWEAIRLDEQGLSSANQGEPVVPGFAAAAHSAAELGAVFYAAGVDTGGQVVDLTVEAYDGAGVDDAAGLDTLARELAAGRHWTNPTFEVVDGTAEPTVDVRFTTEASRPTSATDDDPDQMETVAVDGFERLVLSPRGVVYSFVLTGQDADTHADLAAQIFSTVAFPPSS